MSTPTTYKKGWKEAILAIYVSGDYETIACITNQDRSKTLVVEEKTNTCTQGKPEQVGAKIESTVTVAGEVADASSYGVLDTAFQTKEKQYFRRGDTGNYEYFIALITDLSDSHPAEGDSTFSMTLEVENGEYLTTDPKGAA